MSDSITGTYEGGCLCGAVRFEISGPPVVVARCHCEQCQRISGAGHTVGAMFADGALRLTGEPAEFRYRSEAGNEVTKSFCPHCGSPILGRNTGMKGYVTVPLGTMDDSSTLRPQVAIFTRNRKPWDTLETGIPCFAGQPAWDPDEGL